MITSNNKFERPFTFFASVAQRQVAGSPNFYYSQSEVGGGGTFCDYNCTQYVVVKLSADENLLSSKLFSFTRAKMSLSQKIRVFLTGGSIMGTF